MAGLLRITFFESVQKFPWIRIETLLIFCLLKVFPLIDFSSGLHFKCHVRLNQKKINTFTFLCFPPVGPPNPNPISICSLRCWAYHGVAFHPQILVRSRRRVSARPLDRFKVVRASCRLAHQCSGRSLDVAGVVGCGSHPNGVPPTHP